MYIILCVSVNGVCQDSPTPRAVKIMRHPQLLSGSVDSSVGEKSNLKIYFRRVVEVLIHNLDLSFLGVFGLNPLMRRGNSH